MYKDDFKELPKWLSNLYPTYISQPEAYLCKSDNTKVNGVLAPGQGGFASKPKGVPGFVYPETNDNGVNGPDYCDQNDKIQACSYLYEFNAAECIWYKKDPTYLPSPPPDLDAQIIEGIINFAGEYDRIGQIGGKKTGHPSSPVVSA